MGGGHFLCGPHQAEKWGDASPPRPPPIYAHTVDHATVDLPSPHHIVRLLARSQPSAFHVSAARVFVLGRPLFLFPSVSVLSNNFLSMCSSSFLITCPYQFNRLSGNPIIQTNIYQSASCVVSRPTAHTM